LAIPRVGLGLFFPKRRGGVTMAGFEETVQLGGHGRIKDDPTVVMRAYVAPQLHGAAVANIHWRGVAFDYYAQGRWDRSPRAPLTETEHDYAHNLMTIHVKYDRFDLDRHELRSRMEQGVPQE